jgi:hypothetical protein
MRYDRRVGRHLSPIMKISGFSLLQARRVAAKQGVVATGYYPALVENFNTYF